MNRAQSRIWRAPPEAAVLFWKTAFLNARKDFSSAATAPPPPDVEAGEARLGGERYGRRGSHRQHCRTTRSPPPAEWPQPDRRHRRWVTNHRSENLARLSH